MWQVHGLRRESWPYEMLGPSTDKSDSRNRATKPIRYVMYFDLIENNLKCNFLNLWNVILCIINGTIVNELSFSFSLIPYITHSYTKSDVNLITKWLWKDYQNRKCQILVEFSPLADTFTKVSSNVKIEWMFIWSMVCWWKPMNC